MILLLGGKFGATLLTPLHTPESQRRYARCCQMLRLCRARNSSKSSPKMNDLRIYRTFPQTYPLGNIQKHQKTKEHRIFYGKTHCVHGHFQKQANCQFTKVYHGPGHEMTTSWWKLERDDLVSTSAMDLCRPLMVVGYPMFDHRPRWYHGPLRHGPAMFELGRSEANAARDWAESLVDPVREDAHKYEMAISQS